MRETVLSKAVRRYEASVAVGHAGRWLEELLFCVVKDERVDVPVTDQRILGINTLVGAFCTLFIDSTRLTLVLVL
jgi:hypothetical protein